MSKVMTKPSLIKSNSNFLIFWLKKLGNSITFPLWVKTPQNKAHAPLLDEHFVIVPKTQLEDAQSKKSQHNKQTNKTNNLTYSMEFIFISKTSDHLWLSMHLGLSQHIWNHLQMDFNKIGLFQEIFDTVRLLNMEKWNMIRSFELGQVIR